jgi:hypothetical protein
MHSGALCSIGVLALIGAVLLGLSCWQQRGQRDDEEADEEGG